MKRILIALIAIFCFETISLAMNDENDGTDGIMFLLYTRKNPVEPQFFDPLSSTNFDVRKKVKILIHGWKNSPASPFNVLMKNSYLLQYDTNVIVVDWERLARESYWNEKKNVGKVGVVVAEMIDVLVHLGVPVRHIHVIGHSLGAHVAGAAGRLVKNGPLSRVTGLDPAGPTFSSEDEFLGPESAEFVDIVHTAGHFTGYYGKLGHVDFYPNGGHPIQPGCGVDFGTLRSHRRAYWLFAESIITPKGFLAVPCSSWNEFKNNACNKTEIAEMGEHVSKEYGNQKGRIFCELRWIGEVDGELIMQFGRTCDMSILMDGTSTDNV